MRPWEHWHPAGFFLWHIEEQAIHGGPQHLRSHLPWHLVTTYHISEQAARLVLERPQPLTVIATAEQAAMQRNV